MKPINIMNKLNEADEIKQAKTLTEEGSTYHYIDSSEMNDCVYNSLSNTDVIDILNELKRYFDESVTSVEEVNKNSNHDTGMGQKDIDACKLGSKNVQDIIDAFDKAWE